MTVEEIKQQYSMSDILARYGLKADRKGFLCCAFHNEKTPSMQIKQKSWKCFGCGENGDIFEFVQKMENCSFRDAYLLLGGEYEQKQNTFAYQQKRKELELKWEMERKEKEFQEELQEFIPKEMMFYRKDCVKYEVFSDLSCFCKNLQCELEILFDETFSKRIEVNLEIVYRKYTEIRRRYNTMQRSVSGNIGNG